MSGDMGTQIVVALLSGSVMPFVVAFLWRRLRRDAKSDAEARDINARASRTEWQTLRDEINRVDRELAEVRAELAKVKVAAADEKATLERENKALRTKVQRLTLRVQGLEDILKVKPLPPEMQAMLDKLDEETGRGAAS
jgi:septal ring factor EnvC (AmiA/AmiB activator)